MAKRKITITADGSIVVFRGYKVADIARSAGLRPTYSASAGGWMLDANRLPELVAYLEYRNYRYEVRGNYGDPRHKTPAPQVPAVGDDEQLDLFTGEVA